MLVEDLDAQGDGKNLQANWQDMGGLRAEEKWRLDRTGTSEGWLAVGGVPTPGLRSEGVWQRFPMPNQPGKFAQLSGQVLRPQRMPPGRVALGA